MNDDIKKDNGSGNNIYYVSTYNMGKVPKEILEDPTQTIILVWERHDAQCNIGEGSRCNFILSGGGEYRIGGKRKVTIAGDNTNLYASDEVEVTLDQDKYVNNRITLRDKSRMIWDAGEVHDIKYSNNFLGAYDKSYIKIKNLNYDISMAGNSTGYVRGGIKHISLRDNSYVRVNNIYSHRSGDELSIQLWGHSKLEGCITRPGVNIHTNDYSKVNILGTCTIYGSEISTIIARGRSIIKIADLTVNVEAYYKCTVEIHAYNNKILDNIKLYGNSILRKNVDVININKVEEWIKYYGIDREAINYIDKDTEIVVYKAVSNDYKTQEDTVNETSWIPGTIVEMPMDKWYPDNGECGEGKFHACGNPMECLEFRNNIDDKFVAIKVNKEDLFLWSIHSKTTHARIMYPHKITFRKGEVLYECDMDGNKIENK